MEVSIDFTAETRSRALTRLMKAKEDPVVRKINVIALRTEPIPDMSPFLRTADGIVGRKIILTFTRNP